MVQRQSGYLRQPNDDYATPSWVIDALFEHEKFTGPVWEPAPGSGQMVEALRSHVDQIYSTDSNFLELDQNAFNIITNPPFSLAEDFCHHAIENTLENKGKVAMLLPSYFDNGKSGGRIGLFKYSPFKIKYVLTDRIRWTNLEQKKNGPSTNHAWYVWDWAYQERPRIWWI